VAASGSNAKINARIRSPKLAPLAGFLSVVSGPPIVHMPVGFIGEA